MRKNHQPNPLRRLLTWLNRAYVKHFIAPQFASLGEIPQIQNARHLVLCGDNISVGKHANFVCAPDNKIRLTTWPPASTDSASITIGDYCLLSPGTRFSAAMDIRVGNNCMFAANCYISDSDWHGIYNRTKPFRCTKPVVLEDNVWLGERVIVGKGVHIGENSVIGAGSVVTRDIPANSIAAGNPARVIKPINPERHMLKREHIFAGSENYLARHDALDRYSHAQNTWRGWLRSVFMPGRDD